MVKLIVADLDGTLLGSDHRTISPRTKEALHNAKSKGVSIAIGSGRTYSLLGNVLSQTSDIDYLLMSNGAAFMDLESKKQSTLGGIPYEKWSALCKILRKHRTVFEVYCDGKSYIEKDSWGRMDLNTLPGNFVKEIMDSMTVVNSLEDFLGEQELEKIDVISTPPEEIESMSQEIESMDSFACSSSIPGNLEINRKGVNKGEGIRELCRLLGISTEEVMAFGDASNDREMLQVAGYSVAMGNADEDLKEIAACVTDTNARDGVAKEIERIVPEL